MAISSHGYAFVRARLLCLAFTLSGSTVACGSGDPVAAEEESSGGAAGAPQGTAGGSAGGTSMGGANGTGGTSGTGGIGGDLSGGSGGGNQSGAAGRTSGGSGGNEGGTAGNSNGGSGGAGGSSIGVEAGAGPSVGRYTVFELDVPYSETGVANVWDNVKVNAVFTSPSNKTITAHGFYLGTNDWKVRFAPAEIGPYSYHVTVSGGSTPKTIDGSFNSVASAEKGFVRASTQNPLRLVYESDGSLYNALGMGNCFDDPNGPNWGLDGGDTSKGEASHYATGETYLTAMGGEGKLNIFRWSVNNCAPDLWQTIAPTGNKYLTKEGVWGDQLAQILRKHGFRVYLDMFGWKQPFSGQWQDTPSMDAVKRYVDYIVARYGAYVDF